MIDSIMTIPLLIGVLYLILFIYTKLRIDLFRDKVFQIRRSLFLIAADNPQTFFQDNSSYRFFEQILNTALSYTDSFSLISNILETNRLVNYAKKNNIEGFNFNSIKNIQLNKIKSPEVRKEVSNLVSDFEFHYALFLLTRTFFGSILFCFSTFFIVVFLYAKALNEKKKESLKKSALAHSSIKFYKPDKMMNNSQFAYAASMA